MLTYGVLLLCYCQLHSAATQKTTRTAHHIPMASGKNRTFLSGWSRPYAGTQYVMRHECHLKEGVIRSTH